MIKGEFTSTIYNYIKEQKYKEAINVFNQQLLVDSDNRAALSLMGYCLYQLQDFAGAADCYEKLSFLYPGNQEYKMYFAQSLYRTDLLKESMKVLSQIDKPEYKMEITKLKSAIHFREEEYVASSQLIETCPKNEPDTLINLSCIAYAKGDYEKAIELNSKALQMDKKRPTILYNLALCHYQLNKYSNSLKYLADIIEKGIRDHPELGVGMVTEGLEVRSVGNTLLLHETALVEAFNLKAAIEFKLGNLKAASEALTDMPYRCEEELDPVTLHNQALVNLELDPSASFSKLQFLLERPPFPKQTFANLLTLYVKYENFDLAAGILADNPQFVEDYLSPELRNFLEAVILRQTAPEDAFYKLDQLAMKETGELRRLTKEVQNARSVQDEKALKKALEAYDQALEKFIPILMQQAKIFWDMENYAQVEKIFRKSVEFCNDHDTWKLNVAHVLFMQETKYKEASSFYEPIVKQNFDNLLDVSAIILANLCVTYIMTGQNEDAEELMRKIEKEEEALAFEDSEKKVFHLCIVNLVIGTLYCAKGNYEFGISRVIKSLEPHQKKLGPDTWFYTKRCFLSLIENLARQMILICDSVMNDCIHFLEQCERQDVQVLCDNPLEKSIRHPGEQTVTYEARILKSLLLQLVSPV
ncbi:Tetratricopeptide repeat protein 30A [Cichlidogyrus casuarinus]|uniref:Tetratricopeptide repeat protein 30 n=1 Tax=Cichlidogyrus casuarinus TaxID=1844966 RepID=A0ABD2QJQ1_9PLAT